MLCYLKSWLCLSVSSVYILHCVHFKFTTFAYWYVRVLTLEVLRFLATDSWLTRLAVNCKTTRPLTDDLTSQHKTLFAESSPSFFSPLFQSPLLYLYKKNIFIPHQIQAMSETSCVINVALICGNKNEERRSLHSMLVD